MKKLFIVFIIVTFHLFASTIRLGVPEVVYNLEKFYLLSDLLKSSFKPLGYEVKFVPLPALRVIDSFNKDQLDGIFPLVPSTGKELKNGFLVNERMGGMTVSSFTILDNPQIKSWNDLINKKIAYPLGVKVIENKLKELKLDPQNIIAAKEYDSLIQLLSSSRVDLILMDKSAFSSIKPKLLKVNENILLDTEAFLFLNNKYKDIKLSLEKELKDYKKNFPDLY